MNVGEVYAHLRLNSFWPSSFSRSATCWLIAGSDTDKQPAALRKLSSSATATK